MRINVLVGTLARKAVRASLLLVAVTIVGFGANTLVERKIADDPSHRLPGEDVGEVGEPKASKYIGTSEDSAIRKIRGDGLHARVVWRDGVGQVGTSDLQDRRVNLYIRDGVVVDARRY